MFFVNGATKSMHSFSSGREATIDCANLSRGVFWRMQSKQFRVHSSISWIIHGKIYRNTMKFRILVLPISATLWMWWSKSDQRNAGIITTKGYSWVVITWHSNLDLFSWYLPFSPLSNTGQTFSENAAITQLCCTKLIHAEGYRYCAKGRSCQYRWET